MSYFLVTKTNLSSGHLLVGAAGETEWNGLLSEMALTVKKKPADCLKGHFRSCSEKKSQKTFPDTFPNLGGFRILGCSKHDSGHCFPKTHNSHISAKNKLPQLVRSPAEVAGAYAAIKPKVITGNHGEAKYKYIVSP